MSREWWSWFGVHNFRTLTESETVLLWESMVIVRISRTHSVSDLRSKATLATREKCRRKVVRQQWPKARNWPILFLTIDARMHMNCIGYWSRQLFSSHSFALSLSLSLPILIYFESVRSLSIVVHFSIYDVYEASFDQLRHTYHLTNRKYIIGMLHALVTFKLRVKDIVVLVV